MNWPHWRAPSCVGTLRLAQVGLSPIMEAFWPDDPKHYQWVPIVLPSSMRTATGRWFKSGARFAKYGRSTNS
jgi:hypothetical protein